MKISYEILSILIFLIPGFFSIILYNSIVSRKQMDNFRLTIEALIYSLIVYTLSSCIFQKSIFIIGKTTGKDDVKYFLNYDAKGLAVALLLSIALPYLLVFFK